VSAAGGKSVLELLSLAAGYLERKGVPSARREADALLGHVLCCDRLHLYLRFEERPLPGEVDAFRALLLRRGEREPLQHLLGKARFLDLDLKLDRRALIPRPETEGLAMRLRELLPLEGALAADVGTGSGCLALALAAAGARVVATDIAPEALELAAENAEALGLQDRIELRLGDGLAALGQGARFQLIVSNPPYIATGEAAALQPEVGRWEPALALYSGSDGMGMLRLLLQGAPEHLEPGAWLALECGLGQPASLAEAALASGRWSSVSVEKDVMDVERFLICQRA
jgi:release factor glutamine methyltransferase